MKLKYYKAKIDPELSAKANYLAKKRGITLSQLTERMIRNTVAADEICTRYRAQIPQDYE